MKSFTFSDRKIRTICSALELARDKYNEDAATLRAIPDHGHLADQFIRQAAEVEEILEEIGD
jgi:hypothetical protein